MALFGTKEEKEAKAQEKEQKMLAKYGLNTLSDPEDIESVRSIVYELMGSGLMETGVKLGGGTEKDIAKVQMSYQHAIMEQNFIMIRQLDRICKKLDQIK